MGIDSHLSTCVGTQSPKYLEMAQGHISLSSSRAQVPPGVFVQEVSRPSIPSDQTEECNTLSQPESDPNDRREPIIRYIKNEEEPDNKAAAERIAR
jgi:hypothetical protein